MNGYSEFIDKGHDYGFKFKKDRRCRITELTSHKLDGTITSNVFVVYDDMNNLVEESVHTPSGNLIEKKSRNSNWIKMAIGLKRQYPS